MKRLIKIAGPILFVVVAYLFLFAWKYLFWNPYQPLGSGFNPPRFTPKADLTVFTEPLRDDGYIDYETAWNLKESHKVDPKQNLVAALQEVLGPKPGGVRLPDRFYRWLRINRPPETGEYLISLKEYLVEHAGKTNIDPEKFEETVALTARKNPARSFGDPLILDWLKANEKPLARAIETLKLQQGYCPILNCAKNETPRILIGGCNPVFRVAYETLGLALVQRSLENIRKKSFQEARKDLLACHRLARQIKPNVMVELGYCLLLEEMAFQVDLVLLEKAAFTKEEILAWRKEWESLPPLPSIVSIWENGQRIALLNLIQECNQHGFENIQFLGKSGSVDWTKVETIVEIADYDHFLQEYFGWFQSFDQVVRNPDIHKKAQAFQAFIQDLDEKKPIVFQSWEWYMLRLKSWEIQKQRLGDSRGLLFSQVTLPVLGNFLASSDIQEQNQILFRTALALTLYRLDKKEYPEMLENLIPEYLKEKPVDLFQSAPLVYQTTKEGFQLYSVGTNQKNEEGFGPNDLPQGDDLVVRFPPKPKIKPRQTNPREE